MTNPAAWHPDPTGRHEHRYWDGQQWTEHVSDGGVASVDPLDTTAPQAEQQAASPASTAQEPAPQEPAAEEPPAEEPAAQEPAPQEPAVQEPVQEPAAQQPAPQEPAVQEPVQQPAAQQPAAQAAAAAGPPAGWHADPTGRYQQRYWDGTRWTEHVATGGQTGTDPVDGSGAGAAAAQSTAAAQPSAAAQAPAAQPWTASSGAAAGAPQGAGGGSNGAAIAAIIIGIISLLIGFIPFVGLLGVFGGLLALLFGFMGRGKAKKDAAVGGGGLAMTGIIAGILAIVIGIATTVLPVLFFRGLAGEFETLDQCIRETGDEEACVEDFTRGWFEFLD